MAKNPNIIRVRGGTLIDGQLHEKVATPVGPTYQHVGSDIARSGRSKHFEASPVTPGMRRATQGDLHPYLHGQAVQDETADKLSQTGRSVAIHDGMGTHRASAHERGLVNHVGDASKVLRAGRLSRDAVAASAAENFDASFVHHKIDRKATLPASKSRRDR